MVVANALMIRLTEIVDNARKNKAHLTDDELEQIFSDCQHLFSKPVCDLVGVLIDQIRDLR